MSVIRIALLLVVLGVLTLLVVQNWSPVLPLVFLGVRTLALPLAVWILIGVTAGAVTSLLIAGLFKLSNYFAQAKPRYRRNVREGSSAQPNVAHHTAANRSQPDTERQSPQGERAQDTASPSDADDDWESDSNDDDWNFEEDADKTRNDPQNTVRDSTNYEVNTEPKSGYRSGSVYSYGYREPSNSGVGKTESVYDADYRVIPPPYPETDTPKKDEDWGFEDDDDFEDEGESDSPMKRR